MGYIITNQGAKKKAYYTPISYENLATGTTGEMITWDASGNAATISVGTSAQVLTSNGAGAAPTFQASAGGGPSQASQSALEAETNEDTYAPPDLIKHSPSIAKGWILFDGTGTASISASYNVTSLTDNGTGDYTVVWDTDFSSATYAVVGTGYRTGSPDITAVVINATTGLATTGARIRTVEGNNGQSTVDSAFVCVTGFGDQ
jgi:hypothetical protein